jgi:stage III sporulation protein SpoIIIAA
MAEKPSVIVYGPPGCGKTTNKDRIKRHFGLGQVLDFGSRGQLRPGRQHRVDHLILCIDPNELPGAFLGLPCHAYADVMRVMKGGA